ncbi:MAG: DUF4349 domain-containing protein, partial [Dehalococcoidia bacterium]
APPTDAYPFESEGAESSKASTALGLPGPRGAPAPTPAPRAAAAFTTPASADVFQLLQVERKVISTANLSLEVPDVESAIAQVRAVAESLGGFVQQLSSSGGPDAQRATVTIRVPQPDFFTALERIEALGQVQSRNVGSEDVSERFIDLEARLTSAQREEASLLKLLERATTVTEILTIERELTRVRSDIERSQGQLNFLERRVALATITVTLAPPEDFAGRPPSGSLAIAVDDVSGAVNEIKALVARLEGAVDSVFLTVRGGDETAELSFRVFRPDFDQALASLEELGELQRKEVREGQTPAGGDARGRKPDAPVQVSLAVLQDSGSSNTLVIVLASVLPTAFVVLVGTVAVVAWRRRRA